jgi:hypothetical protein
MTASRPTASWLVGEHVLGAAVATFATFARVVTSPPPRVKEIAEIRLREAQRAPPNWPVPTTPPSASRTERWTPADDDGRAAVVDLAVVDLVRDVRPDLIITTPPATTGGYHRSQRVQRTHR